MSSIALSLPLSLKHRVASHSFVLLLYLPYSEHKENSLQQAKESCIGKYSAPPNARCAESIQAIDDVSAPELPSLRLFCFCKYITIQWLIGWVADIIYKLINITKQCTKDINGAHILEPVCEEVWSPKIAAATDGMSRLLVESADELQSAFDCRVECQELQHPIPLISLFRSSA